MHRDVESIIEHLRDTLTSDMVDRAYKCRYGEEPPNGEEYLQFIEELIVEAYNAEYDDWEEDFLDYD